MQRAIYSAIGHSYLNNIDLYIVTWKTVNFLNWKCMGLEVLLITTNGIFNIIQ